MNAVASVAFGFAMLTAPARPAPEKPPPSEQEIEAHLKALRQQADDVRKQAESIRQREAELLKQLAEAKARPVGGIKAEVEGVLNFEPGRGYFIATRTGGNHPTETRVWLWVSENKVVVRELEGLTGKEVVATGLLHQMPQDTRAVVPPMGLYLPEGFKITEAPAKKTEKKD